MVTRTLPPDWSTTTILSAAEKIMDYRGRTPKKLGMDWGGGNIPAISARNVHMGHVDFTEEHYLASDILYRRWMTQGDMERGDALITTEAPLGNVASVPDDNRYILSQRIVLIRPRSDTIDKTYFLKVLQSPDFQRLLNRNATGSTALGIQRKRLEQLTVPVPPLPEQRKIGRALQAVDDLITTLERSIAKKQAIKQGMMQQLLTGRTRLHGFTEPWKECPLGELCDAITDGTHFTPAYVNRGIPFYSVENVTNGDFVNVKYISPEEHGVLVRRCRPQRGDILMTRIGSLGETKYLDWNVDASIYVSLALLRPGRGIDGRYLYAFTKSRRFVKAVEDHSLLWAAPKKINMGDIYHVPVLLPSDLNEQRAIADVALALEDQVKTLERLVIKTQAIKQGMMQQLLTGRTRLPVPETAA